MTALLYKQLITYQLLLKVDGPYNCIVTHGQNEEEEEAQLSITHLPNTSIVEDRLSPIWQPINQDVVISVNVVRTYYVKSILKDFSKCNTQIIDPSHSHTGANCGLVSYSRA